MREYDFTIQAGGVLDTQKYVDKQYAGLNEAVNYTLVITNNEVFDVFNLIVTDLIPQGANFVNNSVVINGVSAIGENPALGINVGTIAIGATATITMQADVVAIPGNSELSNMAQLDYQYIDLSTTPNLQSRSIDTNNAVTTIQGAVGAIVKELTETILYGAGQTLNYKLTILNTGNVTAIDIVVLDTMPTGTTFSPGSLKVLGTPVVGTVEPPTGYSLGALPPNTYTELTFVADVVSVPANNSIINQGIMNYSYVVNGVTPVTITTTTISNVVVLTTQMANLTSIVKYSSKNYATINDTIDYTIVLPNTGQLPAKNVKLYDTLPNGTSFVANSLVINGLSYFTSTLSLPINIGTIPSGITTTVQFSVKVD